MAYLGPLLHVAESLLKHNPFFAYGGRDPLLHQTEVVAKLLFLVPTRALIADVIGLGKTITALRTLKILDNYRRLGRVLIVVPKVLLSQWKDEARSMGLGLRVIDRRSIEALARYPELPSGWYIGSMDALKRDNYMAVLERSRWDAIVVDEAHKLGVLGYGPNLRWKSIGNLIMRNRDAIVLLLSATPHRGKAGDYLSRLALIDPSLFDVAETIPRLEASFDNPDYYRRTHNVIVYRRSKEDVNRIYESDEIFKPCSMLAVLIEPSENERKLLRTITDLATSYLGRFYAYLIEEAGWSLGVAQSVVALLRALLVKRGLSSPLSLVKTFSKLVEKRERLVELIGKGLSPDEAKKKIADEIDRYSREMDELLSGDIGEHEEELDEKFNELADHFGRFFSDEAIREKLTEAIGLAKEILAGEERDSKVETLKRILRLALCTSPGDLPEGFGDMASGKVIVFTEFKDTAHYLEQRLRDYVAELGEDDAIRVFTSDNRDKIEDIKKWLAEDGKKVLITTDVAGEGLNLQCANVLVNYEISWSPIRLEQRIGRIWRYGQKKTTYVFNLFLADALEGEVARIVFSKLYGISTSLGKLEPILGEQVLLSTIKNEILEHATEGSGGVVGGFAPVEIDFKGKKHTLSEMRIIDLVTRDARAFVEAFVTSLRKLMKEIKLKMIYPSPAEAERVRDELRCLVGFGSVEEAVSAAKGLLLVLAKLTGSTVEENGKEILLRKENGEIITFLKDSPEGILSKLTAYFKADRPAMYFAFKDERKKMFLLSEVKVSTDDGGIRYIEPIGIVADFSTKRVRIIRGLSLAEAMDELLNASVPVDEIYGLSDVLSKIPDILRASCSNFREQHARYGALNIIKNLEEYERVKRELGGQPFFKTDKLSIEIGDPAFVFLSTAFLPEVGELISEKVWGWTEDESIPVVFNYEGLQGREAERVSSHEHYDVKSIRRNPEGRIEEERLIEIKTKMGNDINISLTKEEAEVAKKMADKYWIYLVYGVNTKKPVILTINDPLRRLPFRRRVAIERKEEFVFRP